MKILIVDRDSLNSQRIATKLESLGHSVTEEPVKNNATEKLEQETYDTIFIDPAPLNNPRPLILSLRRAARKWPYIVLLRNEDQDEEQAITSGANQVLTKPIDPESLDHITDCADRLTNLVIRMGDESEDFPSSGGVIAKSAFNQLFLSCIDRADRTGQGAYMIFIRLKNHQDILETDGPYAAEYANAQMSQRLVKLRRQSDIIGQTGKNEFCLLILMPQSVEEPKMAAVRFAESFENYPELCVNDGQRVEIEVSLIGLPRGEKLYEHTAVTVKDDDGLAAENG